MSARLWYVPMAEVTHAAARKEIASREDVQADDLPSGYAVPSKLYRQGIRPGDVLALHDGDTVAGLVRVLALDEGQTLHWKKLPMTGAASPVAAPTLSEVKDHDRSRFTVGIDALLHAPLPAPQTIATPEPRTYTPSGPPRNIILYGPPGTGKTHSVRRRALELMGDQAAGTATDQDLHAEWERLRREGRIIFCTFHQAFAYEEFVEGLRAVTDEEGNVSYEVEAGIFKRLALTAARAAMPNLQRRVDVDFDTLWATMTAGLKGEDLTIRQSSTGKSYSLLVSGRDSVQARPARETEDGSFEVDKDMSRQTVTRKVAQLIWERRDALGPEPSQLSYDKTRQAIAAATGGGGGHHYAALWIAYSELWALHRDMLENKRVADATIDPRTILESGGSFRFGEDSKQYVLVIDEINRANMARVFGELITLLEPDKRLGMPSELRVQLPASKEWFGVPPNLHVIGTMNTADRSIALMDVALRRRFTFEEMMPDSRVLDEALKDSKIADNDRKLVVKVFETLNERLRFLYDREHQIGHAYFLDVESLEDLRRVFAEKVLPLLQEYFFGQWDKLALALGHPMNADGSPVAPRAEGAGTEPRTILTARALVEREILGFNHDDYDDRVAWDIHPAFRPRGEDRDEAWLREAFEGLTRKKGG